MYYELMKTIKHLIQIWVLGIMVTGVEGAAHFQGVISPVVIPEISSLEINNEESNEFVSLFSMNSVNPDIKICKMVDVRDSGEIISYVVL